MGVEVLIPSMFHRRLVLLAMLGCGAFTLLFARTAKLTVAQGSELREEAELHLISSQWLPSARGSILDRKGRVLAQDRPSYSVCVSYPVITGDWVLDMARQAARRAIGHRWLDLTAEERAREIEARIPLFRLHLDKGWDSLAERVGLTREQIDARRDEIISKVEGKQRGLAEWRTYVEEYLRRERGEEITDEVRKKIEKRADSPIAEQKSRHVLIPRVGDDVGLACMLLASEEADIALPPGEPDALTPSAEPVDLIERVQRMPGLSVMDAGDREYPFEAAVVEVDRHFLPGPLKGEGLAQIPVDGLLCHVLGNVRDIVQRGDVESRTQYLDANPAEASRARAKLASGSIIDRGAYRDEERIGNSGIERSYEHVLRGLRGIVQTKRGPEGGQSTIPPDVGQNVKLTIDILLQARVQAAMSPQLGLAVVQPWQGQTSETQHIGETLHGAAVVMDVDTSEVLAMVSVPTFTRRQMREHPETVFGDEPELRISTPYINRAIAKAYAPGSIVKPLIYTIANRDGHIRLGETIACTGHLFPEKLDAWRCWVYKRFQTTHTAMLGHDPDTIEGIMGSCNIFFFTLGRRLNVNGIEVAYRDYGVGQKFEIGAGYEFPGLLGRGSAGAINLADATQMGIGQGPIAWTPMHAAQAYATLARGGIFMKPRLVEGDLRPAAVDLHLDASAVSDALEGLYRVINDEQGTGRYLTFEGGKEPIFNAPGVRVWGKTGTAAASPVIGDPDGEGPAVKQVIESGDHSWFVVIVGRDRPKYVVAVVTDFGGGGGKVSGPIANQVIHALIAEGYL